MFKKTIKVVAATALLLTAVTLASAQVSYVSGSNGVITVKSFGSGKGINEAIDNTEKDVFFTLLFRGVAGSDQSTAVVGTNEGEAQQKYKDYFDAFFGGRYRSFVVSATQAGEPLKGKHHVVDVALEVTVNVTALRKDLETNGVIRKFGF